jgi:hypothetical protein
LQSVAMPLFSSDTANPTIQFWMSALCMAAAAVLAPGAVIGIAAFPLFAMSLFYAMKGFRFLPTARQRPKFSDALWFTAGLIGTVLFSVLHGAIAFAFAHPGAGAVTPPIAFTLVVGLLPLAICTYAVARRSERGWTVATTLMIGFILVNPMVLLVGRALELPAMRTW